MKHGSNPYFKNVRQEHQPLDDSLMEDLVGLETQALPYHGTLRQEYR